MGFVLEDYRVIPYAIGCTPFPGKGRKGWVSDSLVSHHDTLEHVGPITSKQGVAGSSPAGRAKFSIDVKFLSSVTY